MSPDEWNKSDIFLLRLFSSVNPMDQGFEGLEPLLEVFESLPKELRPDRLHHTRRERRYSRQALRQRLHETQAGPSKVIRLVRSQPPETILSLTCRTDEEGALCTIMLWVAPLSFFKEPGQSERRAEHIVSFVRSLASCLPLTHGWGHSSTDFHMSEDPLAKDVLASPRVQEAFWLNVYGPRMVEQLGRERVLSTPATLVEQLPGGAVLWLTRPTPADFHSEQARLAQARALVHLRPARDLDITLAALRQRSRGFVPVPIQFDPDVADVLLRGVEMMGLADKRRNVERFNQYRPPAVSEWLPAAQAPSPDVDDVRATIDTYEGLYAEQLIALFHEEEPSVMEGFLEALPHVDLRLWHMRWAKNLSDEQREILFRALGAWLGRHLVHLLGGRWVPRRSLEEAAVVIGDRAWLPFLRARRALQSPEAALDFSCSQLFRTAQRLAKAQAT